MNLEAKIKEKKAELEELEKQKAKYKYSSTQDVIGSILENTYIPSDQYVITNDSGNWTVVVKRPYCFGPRELNSLIDAGFNQKNICLEWNKNGIEVQLGIRTA